MAKKSSIKIRSKRLHDGIQIRTLIAHPMENGRNLDQLNGELIPAHFIQEITVKHNDRVIISGNLGGGIAKDPFFTFLLKEAQSGDKITISWLDNQQLSDSKDHFIK
ncbi:thiosulfate oxidation carrier complex protein SoxZ [Methylomarinum vadi]|uniref:thiosulfate oxidation carrier complex protein SoxZ n=1 Tax=Methylomarinum vadi TaxID=438855 RepID=UPI0004DFC4AE|nr:thiosulfate oxidation carrier complex protein SoxZ [Methylomarinum vadi]